VRDADAWHVNKLYRPELLSTALAVRQFTRGKWTREQLDEELARQGWSADRVDALIHDGTQRLGDGTIKALRAENALDDPRGRAAPRKRVDGPRTPEAHEVLGDRSTLTSMAIANSPRLRPRGSPARSPTPTRARAPAACWRMMIGATAF
jgi:hypothetical protein